jgi:hypothetical protein
MLRFKGSATVAADASDSHAPKMAPEGGFYEALRPVIASASEAIQRKMQPPWIASSLRSSQ